MDASAPWRAVEVPEDGSDGAGRTAEGPTLFRHHLLLTAAVVLAGASLAGAVLVGSQTGGQVEVVPASGEAAPTASPAMMVVQVSGAVARPGVYSLPVGSRVADAIRAAGGYALDVDPRQTEAQLNLAAKLQDGEAIRVPRRGDAATASGAGGSDSGATAGLVNLNTATAAQLEALPGIGPVTAQKIITARQQQPFRSVDDLVSRKIVSASTLAKFRALVTVG
jgi:competence protein ComEA